MGSLNSGGKVWVLNLRLWLTRVNGFYSSFFFFFFWARHGRRRLETRKEGNHSLEPATKIARFASHSVSVSNFPLKPRARPTPGCSCFASIRIEAKLTVNLREDPVSCREDRRSSCPLPTTLTASPWHYGQPCQGFELRFMFNMFNWSWNLHQKTKRLPCVLPFAGQMTHKAASSASTRVCMSEMESKQLVLVF